MVRDDRRFVDIAADGGTGAGNAAASASTTGRGLSGRNGGGRGLRYRLCLRLCGPSLGTRGRNEKDRSGERAPGEKQEFAHFFKHTTSGNMAGGFAGQPLAGETACPTKIGCRFLGGVFRT